MLTALLNHHPRRLMFVVLGALAGGLLLVPAGSAFAGDPPGEGELQVTSSPPLATQIRVGEVVRNHDQVRGLPLPAGEHRVCFSAPDGYVAPPCTNVEVVAGQTVAVVGEFEPAGTLEVVIEPDTLTPEIRINDVARDAGWVRVPLAVGEYEVCAAPVEGYVTPDCAQVQLPANELIRATLVYEELPPEPEPEPEPAPAIELSVATSKLRGEPIAQLSWQQAMAVDIYVDGRHHTTLSSATGFQHRTGQRGNPTIGYQVCASADREVCSPVVTVSSW